MDNTIDLHDLKYIDEHLNCKNYKKVVDDGFKYVVGKAGSHILSDDCVPCNRIGMIYSGEVEIRCCDFDTLSMSAGQMIMMATGYKFDIVCKSDVEALVFNFTIPESGCDLLFVDSLTKMCEQSQYQFEPLDIRYPIRLFMESMIYCLRNGVNCVHYHQIKEREFFICLRGFYTKQEVIALLYPIINRSMIFKSYVMLHYRQAMNVEDLIEQSDLGRTAFFEKFKETFGTTVKKWLTERTVVDVRFDAMRPDMTAKKLSDRYNFSSQSHFNTFCRKHYDCSATELI